MPQPKVTHPSLFAIEYQGKTSYLLGTCHVLPLSVLPQHVLDIIRSCKQLVVEESDDGLEEYHTKAVLRGPDSPAWLDQLPAEVAQLIDQLINKYYAAGFDPEYTVPVDKLEIWAAYQNAIQGWMIELSERDSASDAVEEQCMDRELLEYFDDISEGLEYVLDKIPRYKREASTIEHLISLYNNITTESWAGEQKYVEEIVARYCSGADLFSGDRVRGLNNDTDLITRNLSWFPRLLILHSQLSGPVLTAVGFEHLLGEYGLLSLLSDVGARTKILKSDGSFEDFTYQFSSTNIRKATLNQERFMLNFFTDVYLSRQQGSLMLTCNKLANNFHILDQVAEGIPEFYLLPEYKQELEHEFTDKGLLAKFGAVRKKYQTAPLAFTSGASNGNLFVPGANELVDPMLDAFFTSKDLQHALDRLSELLTAEEIRVLEQAFTKFEPVFKRLEIRDGAAITHNLGLLNANIDPEKVATHLSLARTFYDSAPNPFKSVMLFWSPQANMITGFAYGDHLLIRAPRNAMYDDENLKFTISVIVHEAIHHVSAYAATEQKLRLSAIFAGLTDITGLPHFLNALEEPLVLAIQMLFLQNNYPEEFARNRDKWITDPMVSKLLPLVGRYFDARKSIDQEFIEACAAAFSASKQSARPVPFR